MNTKTFIKGLWNHPNTFNIIADIFETFTKYLLEIRIRAKISNASKNLKKEIENYNVNKLKEGNCFQTHSGQVVYRNIHEYWNECTKDQKRMGGDCKKNNKS